MRMPRKSTIENSTTEFYGTSVWTRRDLPIFYRCRKCRNVGWKYWLKANRSILFADLHVVLDWTHTRLIPSNVWPTLSSDRKETRNESGRDRKKRRRKRRGKERRTTGGERTIGWNGERDCDGDKLRNYRQCATSIRNRVHRVYALQLPLHERRRAIARS